MAVASIWRRAWMRSKGGGGDDADGGGGSLRPTDCHSTTSGTTYTASTTTASTTSHSVGEPRPPFRMLDADKELEKEMAKKLEHIKGLVTEFRGDKRGAVQRWLSELDVDWVLQLAETHVSPGSAVATQRFQFLVECWILALRKIAEYILTTLGGFCSQKQDQDEGTSKQPQPTAPEFAELVQATVLKMLPFVGIAAAKTTDDRPGALAEKLQVLIDMHEALSMASEHILSLLSYVQEEWVSSAAHLRQRCCCSYYMAAAASTTDQSQCSDCRMRQLLSADLTKLDEAIWGTIVVIKNSIMAWTWTDDGDSSEIHKVTHSIASYITVLWANYTSVNLILHGAFLRGEYAPENENVSYVTNLIIEMAFSIEKKPSTVSSQASFPDESLRFLFLINNLYYLLQQFHTTWRLNIYTESLTSKINGYINSYLHVSWEPVLKCLQDPASPRCFSRYSSSLPKFESKFHETCATQKLWKVPDPKMRRRLRQAITDKVIPVFTQFLEANSIVTPRLTPREVEKMLGQLFEG